MTLAVQSEIGACAIYCVQGNLHTAPIVSASTKNFRIRSASGLRKLARERVLQLCLPAIAATTVSEAEQLATTTDMHAVWLAAAETERDCADLAALVYGSPATIVKQIALQLAHARQSAFFRLSANRFSPVGATQAAAVEAAQARVLEHRKLVADYRVRLVAGAMPTAVQRQALAFLARNHDPKDAAWVALVGYCEEKDLSVGELCVRHKLLRSAEEVHLSLLLKRHPPPQEEAPEPPPPETELALLATSAFSIDGAGTKEIDDAFSVRRNDDGTVAIGIHIALPALGLSPHARSQARASMTSLYLPGRKVPMLSASSLAHYSLEAGGLRPCLSLCFDFDPAAGRRSNLSLNLGRINVDANLVLEDYCDWRPGREAQLADDLAMLVDVAQGIGIGDDDRTGRHEFLLDVSSGIPQFVPRSRTTVIDRMVATFMIMYNREVAEALLNAGVPTMLRDQGRTVVASRKREVGKPYAWVSSPLRRFVDLCNQDQLLTLLTGTGPRHKENDLRLCASEFERHHQQARTAQKKMETYWGVVWAQARLGEILSARVNDAGSQALLDEAPLSVRLIDKPAPAGARIGVRLRHADPYRLEVQGVPV